MKMTVKFQVNGRWMRACMHEGSGWVVPLLCRKECPVEYLCQISPKRRHPSYVRRPF